MKTLVFINEAHQILDEQKEILDKRFTGLIQNPDSVEAWEDIPAILWKKYLIPAKGWTIEEMKKIISSINLNEINVVFISPVPVMVGKLSKLSSGKQGKVFVFHNDKREKKEFPNKKIIFTVAKTGWQLVEI